MHCRRGGKKVVLLYYWMLLPESSASAIMHNCVNTKRASPYPTLHEIMHIIIHMILSANVRTSNEPIYDAKHTVAFSGASCRENTAVTCKGARTEQHLLPVSLQTGAGKWVWKERLAACRRLCFSLLIWTSILMGHLTLIQKLDPETNRVPPSEVTLLPEQGNGKPLRASKMHYLCSFVCSAFSPVARLKVSTAAHRREQFVS